MWQQLPWSPGPCAHLCCAPHSRRADVPERFLKMFIYIVLFYWKTYAYSIDVVFAVAEEFLYAVFFGFTKPIKRPCEMNLALTIPLHCTTHSLLQAPAARPEQREGGEAAGLHAFPGACRELEREAQQIGAGQGRGARRGTGAGSSGLRAARGGFWQWWPEGWTVRAA